MDALNAALLNSTSFHVLDFDDTHAQTAIHPAAPIAPALLALAEQRPVGGRDLIGALVAGVETERRIGTAVSPYYEIGWISLLASTSRGPCRHIVRCAVLDDRCFNAGVVTNRVRNSG